MEKKNEVSKMSLAASKAWITRRLNAANSSKKNEKQVEKKKERKFKDSGNEVKKTVGRTVKDILKQERVKDSGADVGLKADVQREMKILNGVELSQIAKETQKRLDRKEAMFNAKNGLNGKAKTRAVIVGKIIEKAKIERFNGGVKVSGVVQ
jgi:hypothetical protein